MKTKLPSEPAKRKAIPLFDGVFAYFPDALVEVAMASAAGQKQHFDTEPGEMTWDRSKSKDELNAMMRHLLQRGEIDTDGVRHTGKAVWRLLAYLQKEIETSRLHAVAQPAKVSHVKRTNAQ